MACTILIASFTAALMHRMTKPEVLNKGVQHSLFVVFRKESPSFHRRWTFLSLPLALSFPRMEPHTEMTTITVTSSYHNILWQVWSSIYKIIACNAIFAIFVSEFLVFLYFFFRTTLVLYQKLLVLLVTKSLVRETFQKELPGKQQEQWNFTIVSLVMCYERKWTGSTPFFRGWKSS